MNVWAWIVIVVVVAAAAIAFSWWRAGRRLPGDDANGQTRSGQFGSGTESGYWNNKD